MIKTTFCIRIKLVTCYKRRVKLKDECCGYVIQLFDAALLPFYLTYFDD